MSESGFGYPHFMTLAICVPWSGRPLPPELPLAFKSCAPPMNSNTIFFETRAKPIAEARQWFGEMAIQHNAKYLWFWDEDVLVPPHALRELIYVAENWSNVGVVAGIYCLKSERPEPLVFKDEGGGPSWDWKVGEVFECGATGMGCTLIRTDMLKEIPKPWFRTVDDLDPYLDHIPRGEQWTEDLYFAHKIRETKKWRIIAHGGLVMPHIDVRSIDPATGQAKRYELPPDSKPARRPALPMGKKKILDIGAGGSPLNTNEGHVVTVDIRDGVGADYRCDFRKLPFASGEFDVCYSGHSIEHVARGEVEPTIEEWIRVLKPGGELRLIVPNLEWAAKRIMAGDYGIEKGTNVCAYDVFYGQQMYAEDFHKTGFTPKSLELLLRSKGFKHFITETPLYHVYMRAWRVKPKHIEPMKAVVNGKNVQVESAETNRKRKSRRAA